MKPTVTLDMSSVRATIEAKAKRGDPKVAEILDRVGRRVVHHLRSYTGEKNDRGRPVHPGGWGDKTFTLREAFFYEVQKDPHHTTLIIGNTARHAHLVEALDGIFVVRGITEPGGLVYQALVKAVAEVAPEWRVA